VTIVENKPKYKQIKDILLERIYSGEYQIESRFPTENELVSEFGVSKHTILKTLGELVNEDLLYRRQGSGTFVRDFQRNSGRRKNTSAVAFLYYGDTESDIPKGALQLISGFGKGLQDTGGVEMNLVSTNGTAENEIKAINRLLPSMNGVAVLTHFRKGQNHPAVDLLKEKEIPFVSILAYPNEIYRDNINFVTIDDFKGGRLAAEYFIKCKCDDVFTVMPLNGKYAIMNYDMRLAGFQSLHIRNSVKNTINVEIENDLFGFEKAGYAAGSEIIKRIDPARKIGIFAPMSDQVACGLIRKFREDRHIKRKNIVFCGYDNLSESNEWNNNFTSIDYSNFDIGYRAATVLLENIRTGNCAVPAREILPVKLIRRGESDYDINNSSSGDKHE